MKAKRWGLPVAVLLLLFAGLAYAFSPTIKPIEPPPVGTFDQASVEAGARVVALGDCASCHTPHSNKPFAGGMPLATPFGTLYSTNITPDPTTGIGNWSLEAFTRAMRRGIARDGSHLYPAFPYAHYTQMSDQDIAAAYAFLMTRAPIESSAPPNHLVFPLGFRPLVAGWNMLFLKRNQIAIDDAQSAEWNRGRYLVDSVGHCAACHTPLNVLGAEKSSQPFAGGTIDGWRAPALTALNSAAVPWTRDQLVAYLRTSLADQHGAAAGPMLTVTQNLAKVPEADVAAIATYLLSFKQADAGSVAEAIAPQPTEPPSVDATVSASVERGHTLFTASCASCHGSESPMSTLGGRPSLRLSTTLNSNDPRNAVQMILGGIPWAAGGDHLYMPAFGDTLSDAQIADIATYLRVNFAHRAPWPSLEHAVTTYRKEAHPS